MFISMQHESSGKQYVALFTTKTTKRSLKFQLRPKCLMYEKGLFIGCSLEALCLNLSCSFGYWT